MLERGEAENVQALANKLGLDKSSVGRLIRLVNLAPDIIEKVLCGDAPPKLTMERLKGSILETLKRTTKRTFRRRIVWKNPTRENPTSRRVQSNDRSPIPEQIAELLARALAHLNGAHLETVRV